MTDQEAATVALIEEIRADMQAFRAGMNNHFRHLDERFDALDERLDSLTALGRSAWREFARHRRTTGWSMDDVAQRLSSLDERVGRLETRQT